MILNGCLAAINIELICLVHKQKIGDPNVQKCTHVIIAEL